MKFIRLTIYSLAFLLLFGLVQSACAATRIYLPSSGAAAVTPSTWNFPYQAGTTYTFAGVLSKGTTALTSRTTTTGSTNGRSISVMRYVIGPLAATEISGTVNLVMRASESNGSANATMAIAVKIIQPGGADRSVLLPYTSSNANTVNPYEITTTLGTRRAYDINENIPINLTAQTPNVGDYLDIEIGFRQATAISYNVVLQHGDDSTSDLPDSDGATSAYAPWVEFSQDLPFLSLPTVTTQDASSLTDSTAIGNGTITVTGGENNDKRGFVYSKTSQSLPGNVAPGSSGYTSYEEDSAGGYGAGAFTKALSALDYGATYYIRAYSHNSAGYSYGNEVSFLTTYPVVNMNFTLSAWVKPTGSFATKALAVKNNEIRLVTDGTGHPLCQINNGSSWLTAVTSSTALALDSWAYVTCTYDQSHIKIYINGFEQASVAQASGVSSTNNALVFGMDAGGTYGDFQGLMDEPKIYAVAKTREQILADYNSSLAGMGQAKTGATASFGGESSKWLTDGLVGYWKMDEISGTTVTDASGNGNTGTLTNMQEAGTADTANSDISTVTPIDGTPFSSTDNVYNGMWIATTSKPGGCAIAVGQSRSVASYNGTTKTFTINGRFSEGEIDNCPFEVRHQAEGKFGDGMGFDGTNDAVSVPDGNQWDIAGKNYTLSTWIKASPNPPVNDFIMWHYTASGGWYISDANGQLRFANVGTTDGINLNSTTNSYNDGNWHFMAISIDKDALMAKMYIDGVLNKTDTFIDLVDFDVALGIGGRVGINNYSFLGSLDETRIYNRALTAGEIQKLYEWAPGPAGWWKMDENVQGNSKTMVDSSGNGINLTTNYGANTTGMDCTISGKYGRACQFDGVDDRIAASSNSVLPIIGTISVSAWIKTTVPGKTIAHKMYYGYGGWYFSLNASGYPALSIYTGGNTGGGANVRIQASATNVADGKWHFVSATYDGYKTIYYVDGVNIYTKDWASYIPLAEARTVYYTVGADTDSAVYFNGSIDDVRVYNYARTQKQILADYAAGSDGQGKISPIAHYNFNEGYGSVAHNSGFGGTSLAGNLGVGSSAPSWSNDGKNGKALSFDGVNDYVDLTSNPQPSLSASSVSMWVKTDTLASAPGNYAQTFLLYIMMPQTVFA